MDLSTLQFYDPTAEIIESENHLPHRQQFGKTYFITFRLADSLPSHLLRLWKTERQQWLAFNPKPWTDTQEAEYHERFSATLERWLDQGCGQCLLKEATHRQIVEQALMFFNKDRCYHFAWVIMPNHVHTLTAFAVHWPLDKALHSWKRHSSLTMLRCMKSDRDKLWQKDYFDRLIRDRNHFANCVRYIRRNPTRARLCEDDFSLYESDEIKELD